MLGVPLDYLLNDTSSWSRVCKVYSPGRVNLREVSRQNENGMSYRLVHPRFDSILRVPLNY